MSIIFQFDNIKQFNIDLRNLLSNHTNIDKFKDKSCKYVIAYIINQFKSELLKLHE